MCKKVSEKSEVTRDWAAHLKSHELLIWLKPDCVCAVTPSLSSVSITECTARLALPQLPEVTVLIKYQSGVTQVNLESSFFSH